MHVIIFKLDQHTREDWEKSLEGSDDYPTYDKLFSFLENRVKSLDDAHCTSPNASSFPAKASQKANLLIETHLALSSLITRWLLKQAWQLLTPASGAKVSTSSLTAQPTNSQRRLTRKTLWITCACIETACASVTRSDHAPPNTGVGRSTRISHIPPRRASRRDRAIRSTIAATPEDTPEHQAIQVFISQVGSPILLETARVIFQPPIGLRHEARVLIDPASEGHM